MGADSNQRAVAKQLVGTLPSGKAVITQFYESTNDTGLLFSIRCLKCGQVTNNVPYRRALLTYQNPNDLSTSTWHCLTSNCDVATRTQKSIDQMSADEYRTQILEPEFRQKEADRARAVEQRRKEAQRQAAQPSDTDQRQYIRYRSALENTYVVGPVESSPNFLTRDQFLSLSAENRQEWNGWADKNAPSWVR